MIFAPGTCPQAAAASSMLQASLTCSISHVAAVASVCSVVSGYVLILTFICRAKVAVFIECCDLLRSLARDH
jgi:hypothetical protein